MILFHPYQIHPKYNHICITVRVCVKNPFDESGIYVIIYNQNINASDDLLVHLLNFSNGRKPYVGTLNKYIRSLS